MNTNDVFLMIRRAASLALESPDPAAARVFVRNLVRELMEARMRKSDARGPLGEHQRQDLERTLDMVEDVLERETPSR